MLRCCCGQEIHGSGVVSAHFMVTVPYRAMQISEGGGLFSAEDVAQSLLKGIKKNKYTITTVRQAW
jgi:hypothetical protein